MGAIDRHVMLVFTNPEVGQEAQYHRWHDVHLHEVVSCDGVVSGQRYRMCPDSDLLTPEWMCVHADRADLPIPFEFLAIYEIEGDLPAVIQRVTTKNDYSIRPGDSLDPNAVASWTFTQIGPTVGTAGPGEVDHLGITLANPTEGSRQAFDDWYSVHYWEVASSPGFLTGRRYWAARELLTPQWAADHGEIRANGMPFQHLAMYEVGTPYADAKAALDKHRATFSVFPGDSMDYDKIVAWRYTPFGRRAQ